MTKCLVLPFKIRVAQLLEFPIGKRQRLVLAFFHPAYYCIICSELHSPVENKPFVDPESANGAPSLQQKHTFGLKQAPLVTTNTYVWP